MIHRFKCIYPKLSQQGFSLLGVMVSIAILSLLTAHFIRPEKLPISQRDLLKKLDAVSKYREETRTALFTFMKVNGRLPFADMNSNGRENQDTANPPITNFKGTLPYKTLNLPAGDPWGRVPNYEVHVALAEIKNTPMETAKYSCDNLKSFLTDSDPFPGVSPYLWDEINPQVSHPTPYPVAAIVSSPGRTDADGDGNLFDAIYNSSTLTWRGNVIGSPYLHQSLTPPDEPKFDDLVVFIPATDVKDGVGRVLEKGLISQLVSEYTAQSASGTGIVLPLAVNPPPYYPWSSCP